MKKNLLIFTFISIFSVAISFAHGINNSNGKMECASGSEQNNSESAVIEINKAQFLEKVYNYEKNPKEWVYEGSIPCIVDFYANWCGPCRTLSVTLQKLAEEYKGKIIIYKVNVDKESELSSGISSIPALLWCPLGSEPFFTQGALSENLLKARIESQLLK